MKRYFVLLLSTSIWLCSAAQHKEKYLSLAISTTQNAMPFGKFAGLYSETFHPGIETGYGKNFSVKSKHEWFIQLKAGYFYHRYVQHGIYTTMNIGYRYQLPARFSVESSLGAGYMHSIPATAKLKLNDEGNYVNNKGVGRMQVMATYDLGIGWLVNPSASKPIRIFTSYQQRLQMPFVKSYVPVLPYNSLLIGISRPL